MSLLLALLGGGPAGVTASAALTEENDTLASAAVAAIGATSGLAEASDSLAASASVASQSVLSVTEIADSVSSTAAVALAAALAADEAGDSLAAVAAVAVAASAALGEMDDALAASATLAEQVAATLAVIEDGDLLVSDASVQAVSADMPRGAGAFTRREIAAHKARQAKFLASLPEAKLSPDEVVLLARLMAEMRNLEALPPSPREPEIAQELEAAAAKELAKPRAAKIAKRVAAEPFVPAKPVAEDSLGREIEALRATVERMVRAREDAEEDDIETLMLLAA